MIQDIIVIALVTGALVKTGYQLSKVIFAKKESASTCGGCSECQLKKSLVHRAN
jgi:hypothetical protein